MGSFPCGIVLGSLRRLMRPPSSLLTAGALGPSTVLHAVCGTYSVPHPLLLSVSHSLSFGLWNLCPCASMFYSKTDSVTESV
jgi:hypothetical protein